MSEQEWIELRAFFRFLAFIAIGWAFGFVHGTASKKDDVCRTINRASEWHDGKCVVVTRTKVEVKP